MLIDFIDNGDFAKVSAGTFKARDDRIPKPIFHAHQEHIGRFAGRQGRLPHLVRHGMATTDTGGQLQRPHRFPYTRIAIEGMDLFAGHVGFPQPIDRLLRHLLRFGKDGMRW